MEYVYLFLSCACFFIGYFIGSKKKKIKKTNPTNNITKYSYNDLFDILDTIIRREIAYHNNYIYRLKETKIIYDMKKDLTEIVNNILRDINPDFLKQIEQYHSREYVIKYITRNVNAFLIEFTFKHKVNTK